MAKFAVTLTVLIDADDSYDAQDIVLKGIDIVGGKRDWSKPLFSLNVYPCVSEECDGEYTTDEGGLCQYCIEETDNE